MNRPTLLPRFGTATLSDLLPSVLGALGVAGEHDVLDLPRSARYCVLLIDGLGEQQLRRHPAQAPFLTSLSSLPVASDDGFTATAPSTTATSLTSLGTGLPPGRHGVVGYTSRVPGGDELFYPLAWRPRLDPDTYQPYPSVFQRAERAGLRVGVVGSRAFRDSGLTSVALRSGNYRPADTFGERVAVAADTATHDPRTEVGALVYVYEGDLDFTGHAWGCQSAAWRYQLGVVDRFAEQLHDALPSDTTLLVTADHGMVDVAMSDRIDVDDIPALRENVELVGGEARFRHVYTRTGADGEVCAAWGEVLGERATVRTREQAIAEGWFGAVEPRAVERIGDVVASIGGRCAVEYRTVFPNEARLTGLHGALTAAEMRVPLLTS